MDAHVIAVDVFRWILVHPGGQREAEAPLQLGLEARRGPAAVQEKKLEPRLLPVLPQDVAVAEQLRHAAHDRQHLPPAHESVEPPSQVRVGGQAAPDAHGEAHLARTGVAHGGQPQIVDLGIDAPAPATGDRHLVLARQVVEVRVAVEHARRRVHERRGVDQLVGIHARHRAAGHVPGDVTAGPERRDPGAPECLEHRRQVLDRHPVQLHVLPDRQVGDAPRVTLGQVRDGPHLMRGERAVRDADANHEVRRRLALAAPAAHRADAVALAIDAPPAEVRPPFGWDGGVALAREPPDLLEGFPRIQLALEPLRPLRLGLLDCLAHRLRLLENAKAGCG